MCMCRHTLRLPPTGMPRYVRSIVCYPRTLVRKRNCPPLSPEECKPDGGSTTSPTAEISLCATSPISSLQVFGFFHFRFGVLNVSSEVASHVFKVNKLDFHTSVVSALWGVHSIVHRPPRHTRLRHLLAYLTHCLSLRVTRFFHFRFGVLDVTRFFHFRSGSGCHTVLPLPFWGAERQLFGGCLARLPGKRGKQIGFSYERSIRTVGRRGVHSTRGGAGRPASRAVPSPWSFFGKGFVFFVSWIAIGRCGQLRRCVGLRLRRK